MGNQNSFIKASPSVLAAFLDEKRHAIISVSTYSIEIWNAGSGDRKTLVPFTKKNCAVYSPARDEIVCGDDLGQVSLFKASTGKFLQTFAPDAAKVKRTANPGATPVGLAAHTSLGSNDGTLICRNLNTGEELWSLGAGRTTDAAAVVCMAYNHTKNYIAAGYTSGDIAVFVISSQSLELVLKGHTSCLTAVAFIAADGSYLASAATDGTVRVWNTATGLQASVSSMQMHCFQYDPTRNLLFAGDSEGRIVLLRRNSVSKLDVLKVVQLSSRDPIYSLWYDPDCDRLVAASVDNSVKGVPHIAQDVSHTGATPKPTKPAVSEEEMQKVLKKYKDGDLWPGDVDLQAVPILRSTEAIAGVADQMFSQKEKAAFETLLQRFKEAKANLENSLFLSNNELITAQKRLRDKYLPVIDEQFGRQEIESKKAMMRKELEERHKREIQDLNTYCDSLLPQYEADLPANKQQLTAQALQIREQFRVDANHLITNTVNDLKRLFVSSFPVIGDRYKLGNPIESTSGNVYWGFDLVAMERVVIKAFASTVTLNLNLKHPGLVTVLDVCVAEGSSFVVTRCMDTTVASLINSARELSLAAVAKIGLSLLRVVSYLHGSRMVVRDISPKNVFLTEGGEAKIVHLGVIRPIGDENPENGIVYAAPELFLGALSTASDLWSVGVLLLVLAQTPDERKDHPSFPGSYPLDVSALLAAAAVAGLPSPADLDQMCIDRKIGEEHKPKLIALSKATDLTPRPLATLCKAAADGTEFQDLLKRLLAFIPSQRITAQEAAKHAFFNAPEEFNAPPAGTPSSNSNP